jgi:general nucleoside transport system permease protein
VIESILTLAFVAQVIRIAVPYVLAALCGSLTERAGVIDLALEAKLTAGAFAAAVIGHTTNSGTAGLVAGCAAGTLVAAAQVGCVVWLEANQVIVGIALNIFALAGTRFLMQVIYQEGANTPPAPAYGDAVLTNPIIVGAVLAAILVPLAVRYTRWGLRLRAVGDRPDALVAVGVSPKHVRLYAAMIGGALCGAGGAQLSLAVGGFSADMTSGRGYFAVAMVIIAGWRPALAALCCVAVAVSHAIGIQMQLLHPTILGHRIPTELAPLLPYLLTVVALVIFSGKTRKPPAALGKL